MLWFVECLLDPGVLLHPTVTVSPQKRGPRRGQLAAQLGIRRDGSNIGGVRLNKGGHRGA